MPIRDLRALALVNKGRDGSSGYMNVVYRKSDGRRRLARVLDGGTAIAAPTGLAAVAVATGGTFAAGAYFWKVTALSAVGETTGSNEATATLVLNGSANLSWTATPDATGYKVYRGTVAGAENVLVATLGTVTSYTDTGTGGAGAVPGANTTAGGLKLRVLSEDRIVNNVPAGVTGHTYAARF